MSNWVDYLAANPVFSLAMVVVLVLFLFMVFKKLLKWAVISFVIFALAIGFTYQDAQKKPKIIEELLEKKEKLRNKDLKQLGEEAEKAVNKLKNNLDKNVKKR